MIQRIVAVIVLCFLLGAPISVSAVSVCYCTFGDKNDCQQLENFSGTTQANCDAGCLALFPDTFKKGSHADLLSTATLYEGMCAAAHLAAFQEAAQDKVDAVTPTLAVDIPGVVFTPIFEKDGILHVNYIAQYITGAYKYILGFSILVAVVFLIIGGFQYSLGAVSQEQVTKAKKRISSALIGLVLLVSVVLILETVNPQLTSFNPTELQLISEIPFEMHYDSGDVAEEGDLQDVPRAQSGGKFFDGGQICSTIESCTTWCDGHTNKADWPDANRKTIDITLTKNIPESPGIKKSKNKLATDEMIAAIKEAGQIAVNIKPSYLIEIRDGFRPLKLQIKYVCDRLTIASKMPEGTEKERVLKKEYLDEIGTIVAWPGGSNHGSGMAVDVQFWDGSTQLVTSSNKAQKNVKYKAGAAILADIMAEAGLVRYAKEIWHFELEGKTTTKCRCKGSAQCPFPATCKF